MVLDSEILFPLLKYPLVVAMLQLLLGGVLAYFLAERWQRWRQRREFQFRTLVKFGELSEEVFNRLSELFMSKDKIPEDKHNELKREYLYRRGPLLGMDGEMSAAFKQAELSMDLLRLRDIIGKLYNMASRKGPISREEFEPEQDGLAAHRKVMLTRMTREMKLLSRKEAAQALRHLGHRTTPSGQTSAPPSMPTAS